MITSGKQTAGHPPRTLVVGAGPIGRYIAASLQQSGATVVLHGKGPGFAQLASQGCLTLRPQQAPHEARTIRLDCSVQVPPPGGWDLLVLAMKAQDLGQAAQQFKEHAREAVTLLPQNGLPWWQYLGGEAPSTRLQAVDPQGLAEAALPLERIAGCVVTKGLSIAQDGSLVEAQVASDRFALGDVVPGSGASRLPCALLRQAGLPVAISDDIRVEKWRKLLVNVAFNPLGALSQLGFGEVLDEPEGERLAHALMAEAITVAQASGLQAPIDVQAAFARARSSRHHRTSMLQDVQAGRPFELEPIVGVLLELAQRHGLAVPTLSTVYACLRLLNLSVRKGPIRQAEAATVTT
ncbi:ketopantoate reductase family protein [Bordetella bronchiseptica]|uniref:ketopantoate reductase family protein n=1 Tax=Bordetella bronchiseptica TaxID=518 RepID=UPI0004A0A48B|nr:2-dehydropantoate 2-reductase [Bordetella bronchiseptica]KDD54030.1 2-dehydropantoate 2-reductase [Bordetella bronchiseptica OSU553]